MGGVELLSIDDAVAVALDWRAGGDLGPLVGRPLLVVDLDGAEPEGAAPVGASEPRTDDRRSLLAGLPAVLVGVATRPPSGALAGATDVVLVPDAGPAGTGGVPGPARQPAGGAAGGADAVPAAMDVRVPNVAAALDDLARAVDASPAAALALVQLLRAGERLSLAEAVLAESWVYGLLQAGPQHRGWLADRVPPEPHPLQRPAVRARRDGARLDVVLDRPEARNAVGAALRDALCEALAPAAADLSIAEVHLWGEGPSFCAGGDLAEFGSAPDPVTAHLVRSTRSPALALAGLAERLTVHVQGAAVGAGAEWTAFGARVVARHDATFRLPELAMGLVPGAGGTASIPRRTGRSRAAWLALTGETIDAATARRWGLVDEVVDADTFGSPPA